MRSRDLVHWSNLAMRAFSPSVLPYLLILANGQLCSGPLSVSFQRAPDQPVQGRWHLRPAGNPPDLHPAAAAGAFVPPGCANYSDFNDLAESMTLNRLTRSRLIVHRASHLWRRSSAERRGIIASSNTPAKRRRLFWATATGCIRPGPASCTEARFRSRAEFNSPSEAAKGIAIRPLPLREVA